mgnify:CR=1 FL=1
MRSSLRATSTATHELRIWDPWPALLNPDPLPASTRSGFRTTPMSIRRTTRAWTPWRNTNPMNTSCGARAQKYPHAIIRRLRPCPTPWDARENPVDFQGEISRTCRSPLPNSCAVTWCAIRLADAVHGPYVAGEPFPIIPLRTCAASQGKPARVASGSRRPRRSWFPSSRMGRSSTSFLMLRDKRGWRPGGYSTTRSRRLLTEARDNSSSGSLRAQLHQASIPRVEHASSVAQGFADRARLAPLNVHGEKRFVRSREALAAVVARIAWRTESTSRSRS